ncbi:MAG: hypothetical protein CMF66_08570 [Magnetovibrio sp.]|nr:hypothetical protein [Magnetovibrio sp.]
MANRSATTIAMCGIFGFVAAPGTAFNPGRIRPFLKDLFRLSEPRGQEASGLALAINGEIRVFKRGLAPSAMLASDAYRNFLDQTLADVVALDGKLDKALAIIGHCRMVTNGAEIIPGNNHPILTTQTVGIHNGIITNDEDLWNAHPNLNREHETDSEILFRLIDQHTSARDALTTGITDTFAELQGSASIAFLRADTPVLGLATNVGSLHTAHDDGGFFVFTSEAFILNGFLDLHGNEIGLAGGHTRQLTAGRGCIVNLEQPVPEEFALLDNDASSINPASDAPLKIIDMSSRVDTIQRCTQCILPATYPFIKFDADGVCQYCRGYEPLKLHGRAALEQIFDQHRSADGSADCIVAFSGGRDSSYGLHLIKKEFNMNPIAYSYDWGMVTGIARRNQARMLGKLGIEHILRAEDIPAKRRYMRKNIEAWSKRPHLGMVPLFMAGDKFFYDIGRQLREEIGLPLVIFCAGNELERTDFKGGFAGVRENMHGQRLFAFTMRNKIQIALFYLSQYLSNPRYFNESLIDTVQSFRSSFISKDDFVYLFHYLPWDEATINDTLIGQYGWETAPHTDNTWRIGDGYTTFINYIYFAMAGFSEFDTFRSQQIRKGLIDRETGLRLVAKDNEPDMGILYEFAQQVGINLEEILTRINTAKKLY